MKAARRYQDMFGEVKKRRSNPDENVYIAKTKKEDDQDLKDWEEEEEEEEDEEEEDSEEEEEPISREVSHGHHLVKGKMGHGMEDYLVVENRNINGHELGMYAIFDGHSGKDVAKYLRSHLFDNILKESDFWTNPKRAIKRAYKSTDEHILERVVGSRGGSTAVTGIVIDGKKLIVANVGDSRAVLCGGGAPKQVSVDHEPDKEKGMVERRGGFVSKRPGNVHRVDGQLAMTRAFGDGKLKNHITSEPDVRIENIGADTEFVVLASDGLWKVMSNEEAFDCIREIDDPHEASRKLVKEAQSKKSCDDISCIVVKFH